MQCQVRCKSRSRGLDTVFRGVYPEPVEGLQTYPSINSGHRSADACPERSRRARSLI